MVTRHDPWITDEQRRHCDDLAREIGQIAGELVNVFGVDLPSSVTEPGQFEKEYEDSRVHVVWSGPVSSPSEVDYKILVFRKRPGRSKGRGGWPPVTWTFNTTPTTLECDSEVGEEILAHLRRVVSLKCHFCGRERPPRQAGWLQLKTNLVDVAAPEKVACSRTCEERSRRSL